MRKENIKYPRERNITFTPGRKPSEYYRFYEDFAKEVYLTLSVQEAAMVSEWNLTLVSLARDTCMSFKLTAQGRTNCSKGKKILALSGESDEKTEVLIQLNSCTTTYIPVVCTTHNL